MKKEKIINILTVLEINCDYLKKQYLNNADSDKLLERINAYNFAFTLIADARNNLDILNDKINIRDYVRNCEITVNGPKPSDFTKDLVKEISIKAISTAETLEQNDNNYFEKCVNEYREYVKDTLKMHDLFNKPSILLESDIQVLLNK